METLLLAFSLLLAGVFAVAGVAKLADPGGSRRALEDFGVPARLARPGGVMLPMAEIAIAVALLFPPSARWGALTAAVLLGAFVAAIAHAIAHGRAPDCHCFGQVHSEPAGRGTLARNGVLIALAATVATLGPAPALDTWVADRSALELVLVVAGLAVAAPGARRLRAWHRGRERKRAILKAIAEQEAVDRLPAGKPRGADAPPFAGTGPEGEELTLDALLARGRPVALVFVHPYCGPCRELVPSLGEWQARLVERLTIAVFSEGKLEDNKAMREEYGLANFVLQERREVYDAYEPRDGTPSAVIVDPDGKIASPTVAGVESIEELIRLTLRRSESWEQPSLVA